ncbi:MAG: Spy/CpxP family protein refolding chaperone [Burkholderiaceae bacterium]
MKSRRIARFIVAGGLALAAPLLAVAQAGPGAGPGGPGPGGRGGMPPAAGPMGAGPMGAHAPGMMGGHGHARHERMHAGPRGPMQFRGAEHGMTWLRGLNLSEPQRDKVFEIMHASAPTIREQAKVLRQTREELARLPLSADYDQAKARALAERNAQAAAQLAELRARNMNEIYRQLTPEQQKRVAERLARVGPHGERPMRENVRPGAPRESRPGGPSRG